MKKQLLIMKSSSHPFRSERARAEYHALYMERAKKWPVASETRLIETPSGQTFVRVSGRMTDPPLILLPGALGTSLTWIPNIAALSAHYRTYALDSIYDFGLSVRRRNIKKPGDILTWLHEVLAVLVPEGLANLIGLSYGGWVVSQYALRFPERIRKVVLLAPALTVLPPSFALMFWALLTRLPLPGFRKRFYYWLLQDTVQTGESGRASVDEAVADWIVAERCFGPLPMIPATVLDDTALRNFNVPSLFLVGEHEKIYSAQKAVSRLNRLAPQIETGIIPHAGHDLSFVQAELVTKRILDFLGESDTINRYLDSIK
jgi:pimeloyl-ACP methyl ester carboxylesterase